MKKFSGILVLCFVTGYNLFAQNAVLHLSLANTKSPNCYVWLPAELNSSAAITITPGKMAEHTFKLSRPGFINLRCSDPDNGAAHQLLSYVLYLSPGDDLVLKADFNKPGFGITVTGKGSNNNQPLMALMDEETLFGFYKDTLPGRVIKALNVAQRLRENNFKKYIVRYKPSPACIKAWKNDLPYVIACDYYNFKENNKYNNWDAWKRNYAQWQKVTDSLFAIAPLNNDKALGGSSYNELAGSFLTRQQEHLWALAEDQPLVFFKEWYDTDTLTGKKLLADDRHNLLQEKIINKYFNGKPAEFLYATLLAGAAAGSNPQNIPEIFERFKSKYPDSRFIPFFAPSIAKIVAKRKLTLNDRMVFVPGNGTTLNTLEEVIATMKGKTVLVDMWGTWCGPCREEIEKHSAGIREHFKGRNLDYLYIANYDLKNGDQWKKLIAYFDIEGTHLMANDSLTKDIMTKVKGQGFPTTFIIKKDGTVEQSKTQYPIDRDILVNQLEAALKE